MTIESLLKKLAHPGMIKNSYDMSQDHFDNVRDFAINLYKIDKENGNYMLSMTEKICSLSELTDIYGLILAAYTQGIIQGALAAREVIEVENLEEIFKK